jgi:hypothetical protein
VSEANPVFRHIQKIHLATADQCSDQEYCHIGDGRYPWQRWVPAFPTELRPWAEGPRVDQEGRIESPWPESCLDIAIFAFDA